MTQQFYLNHGHPDGNVMTSLMHTVGSVPQGTITIARSNFPCCCASTDLRVATVLRISGSTLSQHASRQNGWFTAK